jgi:hypothetical protein
MKKLLITLLLSTLSFTSSANWEAGAGYLRMSDDVHGNSLDLDAIVVTVRNKFSTDEKFDWLVGFRYGLGVGDEQFYGDPAELKSFMSFDLRGQYTLNNNVYLFAQTSYANVEAELDGETVDEWEFGAGAGLGYKFTSALGVEGVFESFDGTSVYTINLIGSF